MNAALAQSLTLELMAQYRLTGWHFGWMRAKKRLGVCKFRSRTIMLSRPFVERNPEHIVRDTILHEIAHALAGFEAGHGIIWKLKALEIGARPERCKDTSLFPEFVHCPAKYQATCAVCGQLYRRERLPRDNRPRYCGRCRMDEKTKLLYQLTC